MKDDELDLDLEELSSAEEFLAYFGVPFDPEVVQVNRLHILQRFHDYLSDIEEMPDSTQARWQLHADLLEAAYRDFVVSDAATEKVFRVFQRGEPVSASFPLNDLLEQLPHEPRV